ncbi:MAG: hypothetical protein IH586_04730 [Anaerolineaceae bacterium]|nr:hypothetical protein [Anaerolineaceae bacterium]
MIIDRISNELKRPAASQTIDWGNLLAPLGLYLGIWVVSEFFQAVSASVQDLLSTKVRQHATFSMLKKGSTLSIAFYETPAYYDQMELARREIWRFGTLPNYFFILISQTIALVSLLVLLGRVNWILPVILILATLPRLVSQSYFVSIKAEMILIYRVSKIDLYGGTGKIQKITCLDGSSQ